MKVRVAVKRKDGSKLKGRKYRKSRKPKRKVRAPEPLSRNPLIWICRWAVKVVQYQQKRQIQ